MYKKRKIEDEKRIFNDEWRTKYFFTQIKDKAICLICRESISSFKEYNIKRHFATKHQNYCSDLSNEGKLKKVDTLMRNLSAQQNVFIKQNTEDEAVVKTSLVIAQKIIKANKPFSDSEFIKDCLVEASRILCPKEQQKFKNISLSRRTVLRRLEIINENVQNQLKSVLEGELMWYSIALDESVDRTDTAQLLIFIRAINNNFDIFEELLSMESMKSQTTGNDIFEIVKKCLNNYKLPLNKLVSVTTDGAPNLRGSNIGMLRKLKDYVHEQFPEHDLLFIHCIIHQQVLCKNVLQVDNVISTISDIVNFIRSRGLNHREFIAFLEELETEHSDVLYHNHIRWLSLGKVLKRCWELREEIVLFLEMKNCDKISSFTNFEWTCDFAFTLDIITHLNILNTTLQGKNIYAHDMIMELNSFRMKLKLFVEQIKKKELSHFPTLKSLNNIPQNKYEVYEKKLSVLLTEFQRRFEDFDKIETSLSLVRNPFSVQIDFVSPDIQLEMIDLICNATVQEIYKKEDILSFYKSLCAKKFANIRKYVSKFLVIFGSTYICEQTFSVMNINKNPLRTRINDDHLAAAIRINTTKFEPNIEKMMEDMKQFHKSH